MYRSSKTFRGYPCAHRKWRHQGHCAHLHGYSRSFQVWFACRERDNNGFVMDFGDLAEPRGWLAQHFDHSTLVDADDPLLPQLRALESAGGCRLVVFDDVGVEGCAKTFFDYLDPWVKQRTGGRVWVYSVECRENENNSGIYFSSGQGV
ncbi:MAG: 6-pyruvoyl tetrahydropterin synthase family protein [Lysobacterales bacterium]